MRFFEFSEKDPGTYIAARLTDESAAALVAYARGNGITSPVNEADIHITIMASRVSFDVELPEMLDRVVTPLAFDLFGPEENCLVLKVRSSTLRDAHEACEASGGVSDYPSFQPHITLSYSAANFDVGALPLPTFDIILDRTYTKPFEM